MSTTSKKIDKFLLGEWYPVLHFLLIIFGFFSGFEVYTILASAILVGFAIVKTKTIKPMLFYIMTFMLQFNPRHLYMKPYESKHYFEGINPYLLIATAAILVLSFVIFVFRARLFKVSWREIPLLIPLLIFSVAMLLNGLLVEGDDLEDLLWGLGQVFVYLIIYVFCYLGLRRENRKNLLDYIHHIVILMSWVLIIQVAYVFISGEATLGAVSDRKFIVLGVGSCNIVGAHVAMLIPANFHGFIKGKRPYLSIFTAVCVYAIALTTTSRNAMLFGGLYFILCFIISIVSGQRGKQMIKLLIAFVAIVAVLAIVFREQLMSIIDLYIQRGMGNNGRKTLWIAAFEAFLESPIFGKGFFTLELTTPNSFAQFDKEFGMDLIPDFAHNTVFELLGATGIVGFISYSIYRISTFVVAFRRASLDRFLLMLSASYVMVSSLVDNFNFQIFSPVFYTILVAVAALLYRDEIKGGKGSRDDEIHLADHKRISKFVPIEYLKLVPDDEKIAKLEKVDKYADKSALCKLTFTKEPVIIKKRKPRQDDKKTKPGTKPGGDADKKIYDTTQEKSRATSNFFTGWIYPIIVAVLVLVGNLTGLEVYLAFVNVCLVSFAMFKSNTIKPFLFFLITFAYQLPKEHLYPSDYYYTGPRPYVLMAAMVILFVALIAFIFRNRIFYRGKLSKIPLIIPLCVFAVGMFLNGAFNPEYKIMNLVWAALMMLVYLVLYVIIYWGLKLDDPKKLVDYFIYITILTSWILIIQIAKVYIFDGVLVNGYVNRDALTMGYGVCTLVGFHVSTMIPVSFYGFIKGKMPALSLVTTFALWIASCATTSRNAMLMGTLYFIICLVISMFAGNNKRAGRIVGMIIGAIVIALVAYFGYYYINPGQAPEGALGSIITNVNGVVKQYIDRGLSSSSRTTIWKECVEIFKEHPVFGAGFFGMRVSAQFVPAEYIPEYAHNTIFELIAATGVVGTLCYGFYRIATIRFAFKKFCLDRFMLILGASVLAVESLLDNYVFQVFTTFYYVIAFAIAARLYETQDETPLEIKR